MTNYSSHLYYPVHLEETVSDHVKVARYNPLVADYSSSSPHLHVQVDEFVSEDSKVGDPHENIFILQVFSQHRYRISMTVVLRKRQKTKRSWYHT